MTEQPNRPEPKLSRTDFESMTHEQLAAMLKSADHESAAHLASKLSKAASTIGKIGDDLMKHVKDLEWQGKAGDSFRDWGGHTASATLRLGDYAGAASQWMGTISQAIADAKLSMPDVSETTRAKAALADAHKTIDLSKQPGVRNDPDARKAAATAHTDATNAQAQIDATREAAIQQMRKLAGAYEHSAMQVNSLTPPTFAPAAGRGAPDAWWVDDKKTTLANNAGYAGRSSSDAPSYSAPTRGSQGGAHPAGVHHVAAASAHEETARSSRHVPAPSEPVSLDIDSVDTLPRASTPPLTTATSGPALPLREASPGGLPTVLPPTFTGGGRLPGAELPSRAPGMGRLPQVPGLAKPIEGMPRMPRETGIVGGRPVSATGRPANGIPRGTVIGGENGQGRTPLGRAFSPGSVEGARSAGAMGGSGRRLASETGGVLGGRSGQPGRSGGRPFTSGGSGLVRPSSKAADQAQGSQVGRTGAAARSVDSRKPQEQHGKRPDYLVEDEETWARDGRRALPPVVD
ncbi:WXG100 family type VII secretion target [Streptomyces griseoluteus]|uniref:WXG100 family type VII secretion target n=1 Tax=Streptomyces griseoluteus TaxID=29306 RepID=UPI003816FECC